MCPPLHRDFRLVLRVVGREVCFLLLLWTLCHRCFPFFPSSFYPFSYVLPITSFCMLWTIICIPYYENSYHPSLSGSKSPPKWIKCIHHRLPTVSNKRGRPKLISDAAILGRRRTMVGGNMRSSELPRPTPAYQTRRRGVNDSKQARFRW